MLMCWPRTRISNAVRHGTKYNECHVKRSFHMLFARSSIVCSMEFLAGSQLPVLVRSTIIGLTHSVVPRQRISRHIVTPFAISETLPISMHHCDKALYSLSAPAISSALQYTYYSFSLSSIIFHPSCHVYVAVVGAGERRDMSRPCNTYARLQNSSCAARTSSVLRADFVPRIRMLHIPSAAMINKSKNKKMWVSETNRPMMVEDSREIFIVPNVSVFISFV